MTEQRETTPTGNVLLADADKLEFLEMLDGLTEEINKLKASMNSQQMKHESRHLLENNF